MNRPDSVADIAECIDHHLEAYFRTLDGEAAHDVYAMVLCRVEPPMLRRVMAECGGNQSKAAQVLGLNRNTLRKKLKEYGLLD